MINRERVVNCLLELCATDSASGRERALADRMRTELERLGFHVTEDDAGARTGGDTGNLVARLPGRGPLAGAPPILLCAHLDRVPGGTGVRPRVEDGRVASDGTTILGADDAAGLAAILEAVVAVREQGGPHRPLEVVLTVQEEVGMLGSRHLDFSQLRSPVGFVLDGEGPVGTLEVAAPAQARLVATFTGRAAHAGVAPEAGISAIRMAALAISRMRLGRLDEMTTANIGLIKGGVARNVVPELCEVIGEARSRAESRLEAQVQHMVDQMEAAAAELGGRVAIKVERAYGGFSLDQRDPVVQQALAAVRACGLEPRLVPSGGGTDANILNTLGGIPTVVLGTGYQEIHSPREFMPVDQLVQLAELTAALMTGAGQ